MKSVSSSALICLFLAALACSTQPILSPPEKSAGRGAPLYRDAERITMSAADQHALVEDLLGEEPLLYSSVTHVSYSSDTANTVQDMLDEILPENNWRVEADWYGVRSPQTFSTWRNGDLRIAILIMDNMDSEQLQTLNKRYGVDGPEPGSTLILTHMWDVSNPLPTATSTKTPLPTATLRATSTPRPTATPVFTPTPSLAPDTIPGSVLQPGETWYQGGMEVRLKNPTFLPGCDGFLGFELTIVNNTSGELVTNISGLDFSILDDTGQSYSNVWWDEGPVSERCYSYSLQRLEIDSMAPGSRYDLTFRILGDPGQNVSTFTVIIYRAGRVVNAAWVIDVPR